MPFSTERVLLAWVDDLAHGLGELSRGAREQHRDAWLKDLLQSAQGLLELAQSELPKLSTASIPLLDHDARDIRTPADIQRLCDGMRRLFRAGADGHGGESSD
ncbi:hypothetical protein [Dyella telluris]|uniref:Uncharacterized protein n=1 Tax=Dyella telluris TaxID=2763498 RepID=A0A7G8Q1X8_9GAMM|nr:hypothetical protein [Dyella telluris]QNK00786.1 hypothetical protein H8F01_17115 [Dyella telluris]